MSPYIGRKFDEVKGELEKSGESFSWEITRPKSRVFEIDEKDLYVLRELQSSNGERKLVLACLCKARAEGGDEDGL